MEAVLSGGLRVITLVRSTHIRRLLHEEWTVGVGATALRSSARRVEALACEAHW
eukprot:CAMPEP_0185595304 /NCGR_PEP_ID=MMETSP0434-20130131/77940_1 /TAXON_ID=626734 ORGANISM="Favella taraikaensis, Strain Fe Narragansett Bay" /NCGR_SAMPLE_ID=MMETSP0434 /ASSEMBLY_ACC=CAM_ASM_000379 /LENGTH=53 /DNA_ID=CAMNT_0028223221 /DNA_START=108 /DNA_END=266 /DNA_ORIENTATION=+